MNIVLHINDRILSQKEAKKILDTYDQYELMVYNPEINPKEILNNLIQKCNIVCYAKKYETLLKEYDIENLIKIEVETL